MSHKPVSCIAQPTRLLDQPREVHRYRHYSLRTWDAYLDWVKYFVRWPGRDGRLRHRATGCAASPLGALKGCAAAPRRCALPARR